MVPSNFVEVITDDNGGRMGSKDVEVFAASEEDVHKASQIIKVIIFLYVQYEFVIIYLNCNFMCEIIFHKQANT